jgi:hypothetical protein
VGVEVVMLEDAALSVLIPDLGPAELRSRCEVHETFWPLLVL